jgi:hypothetical protein
MTAIIWDDVTTRFFETGIDRGVLYLQEAGAYPEGVPWNGLTAVEESTSRSSESLYFNGSKYLDIPIFDDFAGTLKAITYPDELLECEGTLSIRNGFYADNQNQKRFGLSYRTLIGNDSDGIDHGYKIHILFNLSAFPSSVSYSTMGENVEPQEFSWTINSNAILIPNMRPTSHLIIDSRKVSPAGLANLEILLYGADGIVPHLPSITQIIEALSTEFVLIYVNGDGTWTAVGEAPYVTFPDADSFQLVVTPVEDNSDSFELEVNT